MGEQDGLREGSLSDGDLAVGEVVGESREVELWRTLREKKLVRLVVRIDKVLGESELQLRVFHAFRRASTGEGET